MPKWVVIAGFGEYDDYMEISTEVEADSMEKAKSTAKDGWDKQYITMGYDLHIVTVYGPYESHIPAMPWIIR